MRDIARLVARPGGVAARPRRRPRRRAHPWPVLDDAARARRRVAEIDAALDAADAPDADRS